METHLKKLEHNRWFLICTRGRRNIVQDAGRTDKIVRFFDGGIGGPVGKVSIPELLADLGCCDGKHSVKTLSVN